MAKKTSPELTTAQRLGSVIKSARDIMRKDKGLNGDTDRSPMLTWIMFLKFLDDMEQVREAEAAISGEKYRPAIEPPYRWRDWADKEDGITGDELISFINNDEVTRPDGTRGAGLFAYLKSLQGANGGDRRDVIATVFSGTINRMINGYLLRDVINKISSIHFTSSEEIHTLSHLYESMLKEMRDASGDAGEFYTPRPVVRFMVEVLNPQLGETLLDPACGTGGFLVEAYQHLEKQCNTVEDREILQKHSIYGGEAKSLPYLLCQMNLLLHGLEYPQIDPGNSLRFPLNEIGDKDRVDIVLTNPPFGGEEERGILSNFPDDMQTSETALLFLQLIMRKLKRLPKSGRAAVVVPNGTLFSDGVCARIKEELLNNFNLHTIVKLPNGVFSPYTGIETNLLFFDRSRPTKEIWYYEQPLPIGRKTYTKTKPIRIEEFDECFSWWNNRVENDKAWCIQAESIVSNNYNLDIKNPNTINACLDMSPVDLFESIMSVERDISETIASIKAEIAASEALFEGIFSSVDHWQIMQIKDFCEHPQYGYTESATEEQVGPKFVRITDIQAGKIDWEYVPFCKCDDKSKYLLASGDILFARTGGTTGKSYIVKDCPCEAVFASYLIRLRVKHSVLPEYLYHYFQAPSYWRQIENHKNGTGQPNVNGTKLANLKVPVPSEEKQLEIINHLNHVNLRIQTPITKLQNLNAMISKKIDTLLPSILDQAFKGEF